MLWWDGYSQYVWMEQCFIFHVPANVELGAEVEKIKKAKHFRKSPEQMTGSPAQNKSTLRDIDIHINPIYDQNNSLA